MQHLVLTQRLGGLADLTFAGKEHQDVAAAVQAQLVNGVDDRLLHRFVPLSCTGLLRRSISHLDGVGATRHLDHRRIAEVVRKPPGIDGRGGDDQAEIRASGQQSMHVPEQKIDVEAAFVCLVDDQGVVLSQIAIAADLGQQDAISHELDVCLVGDVITEPDLVADALPHLLTELAGHTRRDAARGNASRLGVADTTEHTTPQAQADLRQLGRFPGAGLAAQYDDLIFADQCTDLVDALADRQLGRERRPRQRRGSARGDRAGLLDLLLELKAKCAVGRGDLPLPQFCVQTPAVAQQTAFDGVVHARQDSSLLREGKSTDYHASVHELTAAARPVCAQRSPRRPPALSCPGQACADDSPYHMAASPGSGATPMPSSYINPSSYCASACPISAARRYQWRASASLRGTLTPLRWIYPRKRFASASPCSARSRQPSRAAAESPACQANIAASGCAGTGAGQPSHRTETAKAMIFTSFRALRVEFRARAPLKNSSVAPLYRLAKGFRIRLSGLQEARRGEETTTCAIRRNRYTATL